MKKKHLLIVCLFLILLSVTTLNSIADPAPVYENVRSTVKYLDLNLALTSAENEDTIKLLGGAEVNSPISVTGKAITIDLNGFQLNVNPSYPASIIAKQNALITIEDVDSSGSLTLKLAKDNIGLWADTGGTINISNMVTIVNESTSINPDTTNNLDYGYGAYSTAPNSVINITGSLMGYTSAAYADDKGEITITGDVSNNHGNGVEAHNYSKITVEGTGINSSGKVSTAEHPVIASNNSTIIVRDISYLNIDKGIKISNSSTVDMRESFTINSKINDIDNLKISIDDQTLNSTEFRNPSSKEGYLTYTVEESSLYLRNHWICNINNNFYTNLHNAFSEVLDKDVINVLKSFSWDTTLPTQSANSSLSRRTTIELINKSIEFKTNGYVVDLHSNNSINQRNALLYLENSSLALSGDGELNLKVSYSEDFYALLLENSTADITSLEAGPEALSATGVKANNSSVLLIKKSISTNNHGIEASNSTIEVEENISVKNGYGVFALNSNITIGGNIIGENIGIFVSDAIVAVGGNIESSTGAKLRNSSTVTVNGKIIASDKFAQIANETFSGPDYITIDKVDDRVKVGDYYEYTIDSSPAKLKVLAPNPKATLITISSGTLAPTFNEDITSYEATTPNDTDTVSVSVTGNIDTNNINIDGNDTTSTDISLDVGENPISIVVTAADGVTSKEYILVITRESPEIEPKASSIILSEGTLVPNFNKDVFEYEVSVSNSITELDVTVTPMEPTHTIFIDEEQTTSAAVSLSEGENELSIIIDRSKGTLNEYIITVIRADEATEDKKPASKPSPPVIIVITETKDGKVTNSTDIKPSVVNKRISSFITPAILDKLIETAKETNGTNSEDNLILQYLDNTGIDEQRIAMQRNGLIKITQETYSNLIIHSNMLEMIFSKEIITNITDQLKDRNVIFNVSSNDTDMKDEVVEKYKDRPKYKITIKGENEAIKELSNGKALVTFPYMLKKDEHPYAVVIKHIDEDGNEKIIKGIYNQDNRSITASIDKLGTYVIDHKLVEFEDVGEDNQYKDAIVFSAARQITSGTGNNQYSPKAKLTRGQFIVMIMDAYNIKNLEELTINNFLDAGETYYTPYLHTARQLGLVNGVGNDLYLPNNEISTQEALAMLSNIFRIRNEMFLEDDSKSGDDIKDLDTISSWARNSVLALYKYNIALENDGYLNAKKELLREEYAQIIYNILSK